MIDCKVNYWYLEKEYLCCDMFIINLYIYVILEIL